MSNITLYIDISGSVRGFTEYWRQVGNYYNVNKANIKDIYLWDDKIKKETPANLENYIACKIGCGGTLPIRIAEKIIEKQKYTDNVIFTDGDVTDSDVANADKLLNSKSLDKIECYIISNGNPKLSVTCPFTRNNTSTVYYKNSNQVEFNIQNNSKEDYKLLEELETITLEKFNDSYSRLESILIAKNMGTIGDTRTRELLLKMKKNLIKELSSQNKQNNYGLEIRKELEEGHFDKALNIAKSMTSSYFSSDIGMEIEKKIGYLVSLCGDLRGQYSIDGIRSNRMLRADNVQVQTESKVDIEINDLTANPIECPIMMDEDVAQIMINMPDEPILANLDKNIVEDIASCPLRILNYQEVVEKLKKSIGQYIGTVVGDKITVNPFTNLPILGTIPLGKCKQHMQCGDYTIARLFSSGKLMGNLNLYYSVIWYLIKSNQIPFLSDIKEQMTEHLIYRLKNSYTTASLCGLPQYVLTKIPTDTAIWYCLASGLLNQPTDRDTLRFHLFNLDVMLDIISELKYPISDLAIRQIDRTKVLMSMLSRTKKNKTDFENKIKCLYQNAIKINLNNLSEKFKQIENIVSWVPIDGPASQEQINEILTSFPSFYSKLSIDELVGLASMVHPNKSGQMIELKTTWIPNKINHKINWQYGLKTYSSEIYEICPATFRPYYNTKLDNDIVIWTTKVEKTYDINIKDVFSGCRKYIDYYYKYEEFPNLDSYLVFCYNRYLKSTKGIETLPYQVYQWYYEFKINFEPIIKIIKEKNMTPEKVINVLNSSCKIEDRIKMEDNYKAEQ